MFRKVSYPSIPDLLMEGQAWTKNGRAPRTKTANQGSTQAKNSAVRIDFFPRTRARTDSTGKGPFESRKNLPVSYPSRFLVL